MFSSKLFAASLEAQISKRGLKSQRAAAASAGVSASTFCRLVSGDERPDVDSFAKLCAWLQVRPDVFFADEPQPVMDIVDPLAWIIAALRSDTSLVEEGREKLIELVKVAYQCLTKEVKGENNVE